MLDWKKTGIGCSCTLSPVKWTAVKHIGTDREGSIKENNGKSNGRNPDLKFT